MGMVGVWVFEAKMNLMEVKISRGGFGISIWDGLARGTKFNEGTEIQEKEST